MGRRTATFMPHSRSLPCDTYIILTHASLQRHFVLEHAQSPDIATAQQRLEIDRADAGKTIGALTIHNIHGSLPLP